MDSDEEKITVSLKYIGGFGDGEGHFSINKTKNKGAVFARLNPRWGVANTNFQILRENLKFTENSGS